MHFEQVSSLVTEDMAVAAVGAVGSRVEDFVEAVRPYVEAGFDEVYLSQIGPEQEGCFDFWERELRAALAAIALAARAAVIRANRQNSALASSSSPGTVQRWL